MKNRILALLLIIILIIATAVCSSAYSTDIPTLYVPETRCFRMALELPEQVGSERLRWQRYHDAFGRIVL